MLSQYFLSTLRQAMAIREIECKPQTVLFEERIASIDTSKMERVEEPFMAEERITDNVFRFISVFVGDRRVVVDLPNTVLAPSDATMLFPRGFEVDLECSFEPLQKFYSLSIWLKWLLTWTSFGVGCGYYGRSPRLRFTLTKENHR